MIETVRADDGEVLAYFIRADALPDQTRFMTPSDCNLQVGQVVYPAGGEIARHVHLPVERHIVGTTEVLLVQHGRCEVDVFSADRQLVTTRAMSVGDMVIAVRGGHGFRAIEDLGAPGDQAKGLPGAEKERF